MPQTSPASLICICKAMPWPITTLLVEPRVTQFCALRQGSIRMESCTPPLPTMGPSHPEKPSAS